VLGCIFHNCKWVTEQLEPPFCASKSAIQHFMLAPSKLKGILQEPDHGGRDLLFHVLATTEIVEMFLPHLRPPKAQVGTKSP